MQLLPVRPYFTHETEGGRTTFPGGRTPLLAHPAVARCERPRAPRSAPSSAGTSSTRPRPSSSSVSPLVESCGRASATSGRVAPPAEAAGWVGSRPVWRKRRAEGVDALFRWAPSSSLYTWGSTSLGSRLASGRSHNRREHAVLWPSVRLRPRPVQHGKRQRRASARCPPSSEPGRTSLLATAAGMMLAAALVAVSPLAGLGRARRKRSQRTTVRSLCTPGADTGVLVHGNVRARSDHRTVQGLLCLILPRRRTTGRCHPWPPV